MASLATLAALLASSALPQAAAGSQPLPVPSVWDAWLESPGGRIEFALEARGTSDDPRFVLVNGARDEDLTWIERWEPTAEGLALHVDSYDSHLEIELDEHGWLRGQWRKRRNASEWTELPVRAEPRPMPGCGSWVEKDARHRIAGRWAVRFASSEDPAVGVFEWTSPETLGGTFLTTLGDYRYLQGDYDAKAEEWRLSCFDGAHAFLFKARLAPDGSLAGDFYSGDRWHETWTAVRDPAARLPDPFGLSRARSGVDLAALVYTGLDGSAVSLADERFAGRPKLLVAFGTWCPNCNDEAALLGELDRRYRDRGLAIVGLAFELTGERERDLEQLRRFQARHGIDYPLLLAGVADKERASASLPLLERVRAYPTTIFVRADGTVQAVHQGYAGPATGDEHAALKLEFERQIAALLGDE